MSKPKTTRRKRLKEIGKSQHALRGAVDNFPDHTGKQVVKKWLRAHLRYVVRLAKEAA